jgi:putative ABC transport system permease protein
VALLLDGASRLLVRLARALSRSRSFAVRHAVVSMTRPGNQSRVILMSVGIGCFFVLGVRAIQANLLDHLSNQVGQQSPDFIAIDIQSDQVAGVREAVQPFLRGPARITPLMRGRVVAVAGSRVQLRTRTFGKCRRSPGWTDVARKLEANEEVTDGAFWSTRLVPSAWKTASTRKSQWSAKPRNAGSASGT